MEDKIKPMCEKIIVRNDEALIFPLPGYLLPILKEFAVQQVPYEISSSDVF
jgi:hypothetical protein